MTFSAYNALQSIHVLDTLAEQHRNRVRQAAQQSDAEGAPSVCIMRASAAEAYWALVMKEREKVAHEAKANSTLAMEYNAQAEIEPGVEDAIWHEIPQIAPQAPAAEDQV